MLRARLRVWAVSLLVPACVSASVRPQVTHPASRSAVAQPPVAPAIDGSSADRPSNSEGAPKSSPSTTPIPWLPALEDGTNAVPYQSTFEAARGGDLIMGHVPRKFQRLIIGPGAEHVFRAYSDRVREPRGVEVTGDGIGDLRVAVLDQHGQEVRFQAGRHRLLETTTRIELLSKEVPRYFFVRITNPGQELVTYDAVIHVWLAHDP